MPEQERPAGAVACATFGPDRLHPLDIRRSLGRPGAGLRLALQIHAEMLAQGGEAGMHLGRDRAGVGARGAVTGP
jgi:hypothetical protein